MDARFEEIFSAIYGVIAAGNREHRDHSRDLDPLTMRFVFEAVRKEAGERGWTATTGPRAMPGDPHEIALSRYEAFSRCGITAVLEIGRVPGVHLAKLGLRFRGSGGWSPVARSWTFECLPSSMPLGLVGVVGEAGADDEEQRAFAAAADAAIERRTRARPS